MQVEKIKNNTTFGTRYTQNSIKTLKRFLPELANNKNYLFSKKALENLIETKKRDDNLLVNIFVGKFGFFDIKVTHIDNNPRIFKTPILHAPKKFDKEGVLKTNSEYFLENSQYINSYKFVKEANRILAQDEKHQAKLSWLEKIKKALKIDELSTMLSGNIEKNSALAQHLQITPQMSLKSRQNEITRLIYELVN